MNINSQFNRDGFVHLKNILPSTFFEGLNQRFLTTLNEISGCQFADAYSPEVAIWLSKNRAFQTELYDALQKSPILIELGKNETVTGFVRQILESDFGLLEKIPFRIDAPRETSELAVWHQDYFYVKGNTSIVTAWIPFQNTPFTMGCLSVMPQSHKLGVLDHSINILKKKYIPENIYHNSFNYCEMNKGDVLFFHALLLHCSNINFSDSVRCSIQPRYSRLFEPTDPSMGKLFPI